MISRKFATAPKILIGYAFLCVFSTAMEDADKKEQTILSVTAVKEMFLNISSQAIAAGRTVKIKGDVISTPRSINRVCKQWNEMTKDPKIFSIFFPYTRSIVSIRDKEDFDALFKESSKPYNSIGFYTILPLDELNRLVGSKPNLKRLEFCEDFIVPLSFLANFTQLVVLNFFQNNFADPKEFENDCLLPALKKLTITQNNLSSPEAGKWIKSFTNLEWLDIEFSQLGSQGGESVGSLTKLRYLNIQGNNLWDPGILALTSLTNLTDLNVRFNEFEIANLNNFTHLTKLRKIYIPEGQKQAGASQSLKEKIPNLRIYDQI